MKFLSVSRACLIISVISAVMIIPVLSVSQETEARLTGDTPVEEVQETNSTQDSDRQQNWHLILAPYFWGAGIDGDVTLKGAKSSVDVPFSDILDNLDYGIIGHAEVHKNRMFIFTDMVFLQLTADMDVSREGVRTWQRQGRLTEFIDLGPGPIDLPSTRPTPTRTLATASNVDAEMTMKSMITEIMAGYRVYEHIFDDGDESGRTRRLGLDLYGGIRYYEFDIEADIDVEWTGTFSGPLITRLRTVKESFSIDESVEWIDPVVGARVQYDLLKNVMVGLRGDVGGFGVGSEFAWSATALAQWRFHKNISFVGGYKILAFDYEDDDIEMDLTMQGPVAALMFDWEF